MGTHGFHARRHGRRASPDTRADGCVGGPVRPVFNDRGGRDSKPDYKTAALCKQVRRVVGMVLGGECGDPMLQALVVAEVLPAPNAGRLLVRVLCRAPLDPLPQPVGVIDVLERLARVQPLLRARVGESIVRKRTPELTFDVLLVPAPTSTNFAEADPGAAADIAAPNFFADEELADDTD